MNKKTKRISIRLTEEEFLIFKEKSEDYPSISSLIIDSVKLFNAKERGRMKIKKIIEFSELSKKVLSELGRVGNNINQIAFRLNSERNKKGDLYDRDIELLNSLIEALREFKSEALRIRTMKRL